MDTILDYSGPIELAPGVYWVGYSDTFAGLNCNPYLIVDNGEAVLIDGGSRPDFSTVMRKILQTGISPENIHTLIYQHFDPDLCGSIPNFVDIIGRDDLKIISKKENNPFIRHYSDATTPLCIDTLGRELVFGSGRKLRFIPTPYAHSPGSFMTLDERSGTLFTSDLLGSINLGANWQLVQQTHEMCRHCEEPYPSNPTEKCERAEQLCIWSGLFSFHRTVMPSNAALRHAIAQIRAANPTMVAPQHGSAFDQKSDIEKILNRLERLEEVGIDGVIDRERRG
ncbi:MAG: MBL fold metallo-hydrolase [Magnetococcales bacterium]|nr:MBL fold metallo-hydrolase [Magnetococcales bacterium]